ncbi:MAG: glycosyltransferase family 4 protein [Lachnospiraceae bacterium]|nr:glycosyltransferase family 4 protein [Lachnospiraceae bacterium]
MKKHILVISQYFYPENFRINDICKEWVKRGYEVTVVTGIPNYPQGKFFNGYGLFKKRKEEYEGVHIIRLPIISRGKGSVRLALNYFSFVWSGLLWKTFTRIKADKVFVFEVSPMTQALVGVWYAKRRKIPCSIYVQDLWPENVEVVTGIHNQKILGAIDKMVNYIYRNCNLILATSPSFVKRLEERTSVFDAEGKSKVKYWPQYAEEFYKPVPKKDLEDLKISDRFRIVFTGNVGYAQGLDILPKTAELLKQQEVSCEFVIVGDGRYMEEFRKEIANRNVEDMFVLLGRKKPEEIPGYLALCDAAFISFADNPLFEMTIPAKLQSYMACGMPIIAVASGETKRIIENAQCGSCCEFGDVEKLLNIIVQIKNDSKGLLLELSNNAMKYCNINYQKDYLMDMLQNGFKL